MIKKGDLVRDYDGKIGVVVEIDKEDAAQSRPDQWFPVWVKWNGNADWEIAYETDLEILSKAVVEKPWFLYVLRCNDDTLYTGITTEPKRRLHEHNSTARGAKYTKTRRPVTLLYTKKYNSRSEAQSAEHKFKKLPRAKKLQVINEGIPPSGDEVE